MGILSENPVGRSIPHPNLSTPRGALQFVIPNCQILHTSLMVYLLNAVEERHVLEVSRVQNLTTPTSDVLRDRVYEHLGRLIRGGQFSPGEKITIRNLAKDFSMVQHQCARRSIVSYLKGFWKVKLTSRHAFPCFPPSKYPNSRTFACISSALPQRAPRKKAPLTLRAG